jgi:Protein of unknown function (DUF433)
MGAILSSNTLMGGWTNEQILKNYPMLKKQDIEAALRFAAENLQQVGLELIRKEKSRQIDSTEHLNLSVTFEVTISLKLG